MRSSVQDILPLRVRRSLVKLGEDLSIARRKRELSVASMTERIGVSKSTYARMEKGDPSVTLGAYAMALFVLGFGDIFSNLIDQSKDDQGLILDLERLSKRIRKKRAE